MQNLLGCDPKILLHAGNNVFIISCILINLFGIQAILTKLEIQI